MRTVTLALAGNPNSGKTTIFNALTGSRQRVGNYPGVTVEKKWGVAERAGVRFHIVDLPGTYSLSAASPEEAVARDFLIREKPDVVVQVADAANLERNLYLTAQLLELGTRLVLDLNMADSARERGLEIDAARLAEELGAPAVATVGNRGGGLDELLAAAAAAADRPPPTVRPPPPDGFADAVRDIEAAFNADDRRAAAGFPAGWLAARLLENDREALSRLAGREAGNRAAERRSAFGIRHGEAPEIRAAEARHAWAGGVAARTVIASPAAAGEDFSDRVDSVVLHRLLGPAIFLLLMYLVFQFVFGLAERPMEWIESGFAALAGSAARLWPRAAESPLRDLLVEGVIGGAGGVLVFLPNIVLLFLAIACLEDSGYMARAAFLMDGAMHRAGLHGRSCISLLLGFGCTVPAIMSARTLENRRDRLATILILPFMSCGARLPIYSLIIPAFFPPHLRAWTLWLIYLIGIAFAIAGARLLRGTLLKGESVPFAMELPPYRLPTPRSILVLTRDRAGEYCKKAGTIILGVGIVLWAMTAYPKKAAFDQDYEAEAAAARAAALAAAADFGSRSGLGGDLLAGWLAARLNFEAAADEYWEGEPGLAAAGAARAAAEAELLSRPGGERLGAFAEELRAAEEKEDEDEGEGGDEPSDAEATGAAAFRREVLAPLAARLAELENDKAGEELAYSVSGRLGTALEPILRPLGFDWRVGTAIIGSFAAKEVFVAQMGIVHALGGADENSESLRRRLAESYTPLQAFCMMLYALLSTPCVATIAVARRETGSWKYALGMLLALTLTAYLATLAVNQAGLFLGWGA